MKVRHFGHIDKSPTKLSTPSIVRLQVEGYHRFLQPDVPMDKRKAAGLQTILDEIFPILNLDGSVSLKCRGYQLGKPRYTADEARELGLTYGVSLRLKLILDKKEPVEEDVYLGEVPLIVGGGEFIINGAERVIVTQLHRSPGIDFGVSSQPGERALYSCWIVPERGSWVELEVSKKDILTVKIDQSGKFPATMFLRALNPDYVSNAEIIRDFYKTRTANLTSKKAHKDVLDKVTITDIVDTTTGEVICHSGEVVTDSILSLVLAAGVKKIEVIEDLADTLILNTLAEEAKEYGKSEQLGNLHEKALLRLYQKLRPGNPENLEKATELADEKFRDVNRYRLGAVGRFRLNRKLNLGIPDTEMTLTSGDLLQAVRYIIGLRLDQGEIDDIDHLGNRRIRTIEELAGDEFRRGFIKLKRNITDRLNQIAPEDLDKVTPKDLVNSKTVSSAIEYFFGRSELSQVVDQTNPLSQLTHERRLSALGPGGLNRKRANFQVRDVHISHYGRICPIETPEGTNIGLISSLCFFAKTDEYGFLTTPYQRVKNARLADEIVYLRADQEDTAVLAPYDTPIDSKGRIAEERVLARKFGELKAVSPKEVQFMDISPKQLVGISASLIPFLEHNDANRALMGSNMQRQAVPLVRTEPPLVATGVEKEVAEKSSMVITAKRSGTVAFADAEEIDVIPDAAPSDEFEEGEDRYHLKKYFGLNERTTLNQRPIVKAGDKVKKGQVIADGAATSFGELALGRNVLVAFMPWDGYNFEDAIVASEELVRKDLYTSIHIEEFEVVIRDTKLGPEEFTNDISQVSEKKLKNLGPDGVVRVGTRVKPGDILVGKVAPRSRSEPTPEEKLLRAIFKSTGDEVKNDSLEVPPGIDGIVIGARKFSRKLFAEAAERKESRRRLKEIDGEYNQKIAKELRSLVKQLRDAVDGQLVNKVTGQRVTAPASPVDAKILSSLKDSINVVSLDIPRGRKEKCRAIIDRMRKHIEPLEEERDRLKDRIARGDELPPGVREMVKVFVATKRVLSVGDKMAGRHGNKGVISKIVAREDMPFLKDGTPVDIILNPLGVPSRMNVGQILETHLGWAAKHLGFQAVVPVFDGPEEAAIEEALVEAGLPTDGKFVLYDGRTGEPFHEKVTVGIMYMLKLHHLVDDKIHARATGPYSLITQQPLGGKARMGGQRFGEMEVWALEAYGAANVLQELLTVKSDDVEGRTKIFESMVKGENTLEPGTPVSFEVLTKEIRGLALNFELDKKQI